MLIFISDIHLTDGSSGETIKPGAFKKFTMLLEDLVQIADTKEVELVFLGDIFDVIRSDYWLESQIRPWSKPNEKDGLGKNLRNYTETIVDRICSNNPDLFFFSLNTGFLHSKIPSLGHRPPGQQSTGVFRCHCPAGAALCRHHHPDAIFIHQPDRAVLPAGAGYFHSCDRRIVCPA